MEQMEILLSVPTISKTPVSSTPKAAVTDDDKSFADLYQQNIQESKSSNSETTHKNVEKKDESASNSVESETKVESKSDDDATTKSEIAEEKVDESMVAVNWLSILDLAADSTNEESAETGTEAENVVQQVVAEAQSAATEVDTEISLAGDGEAKEDFAVKDETIALTDEKSQVMTSEQEIATESVSTAAAPVSNQVSETTVEGITEETTNNEVVVNTVQNEVVAQTANVAAKQTTETNNANTEFSTMMSNDIPQNNLQESVMTQIENSFGKIVKTGNNEVRIQLEPEQLGVLNIRIIAGKDGTQVVFKADSHQSSQLIAAQTESLKTMLNEAGIKVDQIVVNDFSFSQETYQDQQAFEQQNGKSNKFYKSLNGNSDQIETFDNSYELPQTIVGLNYLI
jgi:hypothetical protein